MIGMATPWVGVDSLSRRAHAQLRTTRREGLFADAPKMIAWQGLL